MTMKCLMGGVASIILEGSFLSKLLSRKTGVSVSVWVPSVNFIFHNKYSSSPSKSWSVSQTLPEPDGDNLEEKPQTNPTHSISKSWAAAILAEKKHLEQVNSSRHNSSSTEDNSSSSRIVNLNSFVRSSGVSGGGSKTNTETTSVVGNSGKRPSGYRRRLEDMSWTKEPMDQHLIWVDCEMTGLDYNKEMIMEIGVVITDPQLNEVARRPSVVIHVPDEKLNGMEAWCLKHHGDSGLTEACRQSSLTSEDVDDMLLAFVKKHTKSQECPMAGNSIYMDRIFISKQFPKFHSHFHYRNIDVSSIKELVRRWFPEEYSQAPKKKFSHRVLDDIMDSIAELKYYKSAVFREDSTIAHRVPSTTSKQGQKSQGMAHKS